MATIAKIGARCPENCGLSGYVSPDWGWRKMPGKTLALFPKSEYTDGMLTVKEAAERLGVTDREVRYLCARGKLRATKVGWIWVISERALENYIRERNGEK